MQFDSLSIVGVGLIGGSIGLAARQARIVRRIVGVGRNPASLKEAQSLGIIDEATTDLTAGVRGANLVIFCTPVDRIPLQIKQVGTLCQPGTLITDAGSTKARIVRDVEGQLPAGIHFVGSHPLAGSEKRGAEFARADLFQKRVTVITPTPQSDENAVARIQAFWKALGSSVHILDPESHDRALALTSHLPHLVASALAGILPAQDRPFTASGFRDTTRIAAGDPELWTAIFRENAAALSEALKRFMARMEEYHGAVEKMDQDELIRLWTQGKQVRDALGS
jgi:prephenate dehydrogenase